MTARIVGLGVALCVIVGAGCGGSSGNSSTTFSCNNAAAYFCFDETVPSSLSSSQVTQLQNACTNSGWTFSSGASCPSTNRVGSCSLTNTTGVSGVSVKERFYSPGYTAQNAQLICTQQSGTWTPG